MLATANIISDRNSRTHKACTERCPMCEGPRYGLTARAVLEVGLLSIVCDPRLCALVVNVVIERSLSLITWKCLNVLYCKVLCRSKELLADIVAFKLLN